MADAWLGIGSAEEDSNCGEALSPYTLGEALDGTGEWIHDSTHTHWFVIDLGETYTIKKVRGRSNDTRDPVDVNIYIDDDNPPTTLIEEGITTWRGTSDWVEIDIADSDGRYIKVEIEDTEVVDNELWFGKYPVFMTIFDAYGDVAAGGAALTHTCSDTMTISDSIATKSVMKFTKADTMTIGDAIETVSAMKHAAADTMDISDVGGVIASLQMKIDLADQMDISDSAVFVLSEAEIAAIRRLGIIYGVKPARVTKIGHIGV